MDIALFAKLNRLLDVPGPEEPTKEEMVQKYNRQVRYEREKGNFWFFTTAISDELFF
mgnify:CR=1 FL=1